MAKRNRTNNEKLNEKKRKEGRGKGSFENYKPWLRIQDVASKGLSTRIKGWKTNRIHQFLSKLELSYFYLLEWSKEVIDIREQFPLDLSETRAISSELGIKHPTDPLTQAPIVMTTDFVITLKKEIGSYEIVRTTKYAEDLRNRRTLEKFEIEKAYWQNRNIGWAIVTERDINPVTVENIKWLHSYRDEESLPPEITKDQIQKSFLLISNLFTKKSFLLNQITQTCDLELGLSEGQGINIFRYLAANHLFNFDITQPLNPRKKVCLLSQTAKGGLR